MLVTEFQLPSRPVGNINKLELRFLQLTKIASTDAARVANRWWRKGPCCAPEHHSRNRVPKFKLTLGKGHEQQINSNRQALQLKVDRKAAFHYV